MLSERRSFLKQIGGFASIAIFQKPASAVVQTNEGNSDIQVDQSLSFMERDSSELPAHEKGYFSSYLNLKLRLLEIDLKNSTARFLVNKNGRGEVIVDFLIQQEGERIYFSAPDLKYFFFWKPSFGLYTLDDQRIVELCHPMGNVVPQASNIEVVNPLDKANEFYSTWLRQSLWAEGAPKSPLKGFEAFGEESLYFDSLNERDEKIAKGFDRFLNSIPFGLAALKAIAKCAPKNAERIAEVLIPKVFGWMIGPNQLVEPGKLLLTDCPYRKRMGTYPCESTCGHAMGKYFTEQVGIPMRFDPTIDGNTKCHILIGKEQCSKAQVG